MDWSPVVQKFAKAISVAEGSPVAWNNPGSLKEGDAGSFPLCGVGNSEGVVKFVNYEDGWNALCIKIDRVFRGKSKQYALTDTLEYFGFKYSGGVDAWAENVGKYLGIPVTTTIQQIVDQG